MRFRDEELTFKVKETTTDVSVGQESEATKDNKVLHRYPAMTKTLGPFKLTVQPGTFKPSEVVMMLGQNGTGKTTLIKLLAGILQPDQEDVEMPKLSISYKPQTIAPKFDGTVQELLFTKLKESWSSSIFKTEVLGPLNIESLLDN
jgi:ATP-binding cassette subfamily E protein 1